MANGWINEKKQSRLEKIATEDQLVSRKAFNMILGAVVLYGLLINVILCFVLKDAYVVLGEKPVMLLLGAFSVVGILIAQFSKQPIVSFLGYNLIVIPLGMLVAGAVQVYTALDPSIVRLAFVQTAGITIIMVTASFTFPQFFENLGGVLFLSLILILIAGLFTRFAFPQMGGMIAWASAGIFSLYIGYDMYRAQEFQPTVDNAVDCAVDIYLDIINLFLRMLEIVASKKNND